MNISQPKPRSEKFDYDNDDDDNYDNNNNNNNNKLNFVTAALAVNRRFLFLKNWVQFHSSSCEICRGQSGTGGGYYASISVSFHHCSISTFTPPPTIETVKHLRSHFPASVQQNIVQERVRYPGR